MVTVMEAHDSDQITDENVYIWYNYMTDNHSLDTYFCFPLLGKIEDKVHLSPPEGEIGAELGNFTFAMILKDFSPPIYLSFLLN